MARKDDDLEEGSADLFDGKQIREYLAFATGAIRRRRALVAAVASGIMALAALTVAALPRTYHVEARLLTQRSAALAVRGDGQEAMAPTRGAVETIRRRDNLVALVEATGLLQHWKEHRAPVQRLVDGIRGLFHGPDDPDEQLDAMVERLEKKLNVWTNESTVVITIDWTDPRMAARLVDIAQQNFLEARHAQEITALAESIAILESHAGGLRSDVDDAVAALEDLRGKQAAPADAGPSASATPSSAPARLPAARRPTGPSPEQEQVAATLVAKRRALDDLEELRRRRLSEAQMRLAEQKATYTEAHPVIIDLKQTISALESPSPQIKALRSEIASLRGEQEKLSGEHAGGAPEPQAAMGATGASSAPRLSPIPREIMRLDEELREDRDPGIVYARGKLRDAMDKYAALYDKVHSSQIDLETAQAAFKYRYSVLTPAKIPRQPVKPNLAMTLIASLFAALVVAALVAIVADIRSGLLVERWQIERLLDRPILGEIVLPQLPRPGDAR